MAVIAAVVVLTEAVIAGWMEEAGSLRWGPAARVGEVDAEGKAETAGPVEGAVCLEVLWADWMAVVMDAETVVAAA